MPLGPSWFFPCWLVSSALWLESWPSSTTLPLMGLTRHLQPVSSSSSPVSSSPASTHRPLWHSETFSQMSLMLSFCAGFFVLLAMAVYTGVTVNYYGKRYGSWRFSWSYIMGWVAVVLTFFSGLNVTTLTTSNTSGGHLFLILLLIFHCSDHIFHLFSCLSCCFLPGIFYMCAYRMHECPRNSNSRWPAEDFNTNVHTLPLAKRNQFPFPTFLPFPTKLNLRLNKQNK